jgi:ketosteroid isomerase-like protein
MNRIILTLICAFFISCSISLTNPDANRESINATLDAWHKAAANADYENYFKPMSEDAIFIGTDATENWNKADFMVWSKPYFDKGKAWNFTALERNIYFGEGGKIAWFDELLNTQMKICRGSGVMVKTGDTWMIQQYVLSMTIPNELSDSIIGIKSAAEDEIIKSLQEKR